MSHILYPCCSRLREGRVRFNVSMHSAERESSSGCKWALTGETYFITWYGLATNLYVVLASRSRVQSGEELPEVERPSLNDVAKDGVLAIVAGSDTTSGALTATLYYLLCNPTAYDSVQAEVDTTFPTGEEPLDVTKLSQMEWLNGCM